MLGPATRIDIDKLKFVGLFKLSSTVRSGLHDRGRAELRREEFRTRKSFLTVLADPGAIRPVLRSRRVILDATAVEFQPPAATLRRLYR